MYFSIAIEFGRGKRPQIIQRGITADSWRRLRKLVKKRDGSICQYCGVFVKNGHTDHIVPLSQGGTDSIDNLAWSCQRCNQSKGTKSLSKWTQPELLTPKVDILTVHINIPNEPTVVWDIDFEPGDLLIFAKAALENRLTERKSGLSQIRFWEIRDEALFYGLIEWISISCKRRGTQMTLKGRQTFEQILQEAFKENEKEVL